MTGYLIELLNTITPYVVDFPLFLYPMWKTRNIKTKFVCIYLICFFVFAAVMLFIARQFTDMNINTIHSFKLLITPPAYILPFIVFRKRMWKNIFVIAMTFMYSPFFLGLGTYTAEKLFVEHTLLYAGLISIVIAILSFPPLLIMLRRICNNPNTEQATSFWRLAWIVPASFFMIIIVKDNYIMGNNFDSWFIVIRILAYAISLMLCFLFDTIVRQISESEAAKRKAEEEAEKTDFYRKMSHALRTPLTIVSTNIQTVHRRPEEADELLPQSQEEIMKIAKMIDDALNNRGTEEVRDK